MSNEETLLEFPCRFPIKAMGAGVSDFPAIVEEIVSRHLPKSRILDCQQRPSSGGRYLAVTITVQAETKAELDAIYRDLSAHPRVVVAL